MNENACICPFVKCRVSAGTRKRRSKKGDLSCRIDCYSYMARFGTKHAGQAISRAHGKCNSLFPVKFCYILRACLTKKSVIYVQNSSPERSDYDLARYLFTLKRFQYCRFQNTFQLAFFPSLLSTCRSRLLFKFARRKFDQRRKFGVDRRITINMEVNLCHSVVPQACNVILQCMHIYKVILSHSKGSSSARRLELDGRLHNY